MGCAQRNTLLALIASAKVAQAAAATTSGNTSEKHRRSHTKWWSFLSSIGLQNDFFLNNFSSPEKHQILSTFLVAIHSNKFTKSNRSVNIKAESCSAAHPAQAFSAADHPCLTKDGKLAVILWQQMKYYAIPIEFRLRLHIKLFLLLHLYSSAITTIELASAELQFMGLSNKTNPQHPRLNYQFKRKMLSD